MRALLLTVLVSFQLTACVTGDNAEDGADIGSDDDAEVAADDIAGDDITVADELYPDGVLTEDDGFDLGAHLSSLQRAWLQLTPAPMKGVHKVPRERQLE